MKRQSERDILASLLDPVTQSLNVEAAQKLARLKINAKAQVIVDALARKCNEGELTPEERARYERYVSAGNVLSIMKAKARQLLAKKSP